MHSINRLKSTIRVGLPFILSLLTAASLSSSPAQALSFGTETLVPYTNYGVPSAAIDSAGTIHTVFFEGIGQNGHILYAKQSGGSWTVEHVVSGLGGSYLSLALFHGEPRIAFYNAESGDLRYASRSGGTWSLEWVESSGDVGKYCSLALASDGTPRISYRDAGNQDLKYATKASGSWVTSIVDSAGGANLGEWSSLALDSFDRPHIAYRDATNDRIRYATNAGSWVFYTVDSFDSPTMCSITVLAHGIPSIAFYRSATKDLVYAEWNLGNWDKHINATGDVGYAPSLARSADNQAFISYHDLSSLNLYYAHYDGTSTWTTELVDAGRTAGMASSIVLNVLSGAPSVVYTDQLSNLGDGNILSATRTGASTWSVTSVAGASDDIGTHSAICRWDTSNRDVAIYYYGVATGDLRRLVTNGAGWDNWIIQDGVGLGQWVSVNHATKTAAYYDGQTGDLRVNGPAVYTTGDVGKYTSLADSAGLYRSSFYDATNGNLMLASQHSSGWNLTVIDSTGDVGLYTSIQTDASGNPLIAYYDATNGDLKLAKRVSGAWTTSKVDSSGDVGQHTSLGLSSGAPRIAYYDVTNGNLRYASLSGSTWTLQTVESTNDVGRWCSLRLDSLAAPRIAYYDVTNGDLRYAARKSGSWGSMLVESTGDVGKGASLTLVTLGSPRISYYDATNGDLKWAYADSIPPGGGGGGGGGGDDPPRDGLAAKPAQEEDGVIQRFEFRVQPLVQSAQVPIGFYSPRADFITLEVHDVLGRRVHREQFSVAIGRHVESWNLSAIGSGIFFVTARTTSGESRSQRMVVLR